MRKHGLFVIATVVCASVAGFAQQTPDRSHPPQPGPPPALHLPAIRSRSCPTACRCGSSSSTRSRSRRSTSSSSAAANDPPGNAASPALVAACWRRRLAIGARDRRRDRLPPAPISAPPARRTTPPSGCTCRYPARRGAADHGRRRAAADLPEGRLERERQQRLTSLLQGRDDPPTISSVAFSRILYGKEHRYGTPQMGTAETIKTFTSDDPAASTPRPSSRRTRCCSPHRRHHRRQGGAAVRKSFGAWKGPARRRRRLPATAEPPARDDFPDRQAGRGAIADPHRPGRGSRARPPTTSQSRC